MTQREREKELKQMEELKESLNGNPEKCIALLVGAGIITPKGNLRKPFRNLYIPQEES